MKLQSELDRERTFVHRANYLQDGVDVFDYLTGFARHWQGIEVDLTMTGLDTFEFCHPTQLGESRPWKVGPELFQRLVYLGPSVTWMLDIKFQDTGVMPKRLVETACQVLGEKVMFVSSQPALLTAGHRLGKRTAQFFREGVSGELTFEPDFYVQLSEGELRFPLSKCLVYCQSVEEAEAFLARGAGLVQLDASVLR